MLLPNGLVIAAPASGSGKTVLTLGLLRALAKRDVAVGSFKVGPDYIDPAFHEAASGRACRNLDSWAMRPSTLARILAAAADCDLVLVEGVMGLFDGAADGERGSTADVAALTGWPVLLVVDARGQGASVAALVEGFARHRADTPIAGVLLNRVGSRRHESILKSALAPLGIPTLGAVPSDDALALPSRHLGLVQAGEHGDLDRFLDRAAGILAHHVDLTALAALAAPGKYMAAPAAGLKPLGSRIAVARDSAFSFTYPSLLETWREGGAEIAFFSPLADEGPGECDAVYLPGGYPELHGGRLAAALEFKNGLAAAAARGALVYGECGGYMVLGQGLVDAKRARHAMAGLLGHETSFAERRLHLGYRSVTLKEISPLGAPGEMFRGHEFHYATPVTGGADAPLFLAADSSGRDLGPAGCRRGAVMGSFIHLIDRADDTPREFSRPGH